MTPCARASVLAAVLLAGAAGPIGASQAPPPKKGPAADHDALTAARFEITIDGVPIASFFQIVSLSWGVDPQDLELGAGGVALPARRTPPTVVLKRGMTRGLQLQEWLEAALLGDPAARKSCSLVMYNTKGDPVARYHLENAWPAKIEIGSLKAGASEVLLETVTIVADEIRDDRRGPD
jgi:phage tail-like protein